MNQTLPRPVNPIPAPGPARIRVAGHLGELVQGRMGPGGPVALVTLPCPALVTDVRYFPTRGGLSSAEPVSAKMLAAARLALDAIGRPGWGGRLALNRASLPGSGAGSSTAETLATVRAVALAFGAALTPGREAAICLRAEGAIDPLMLEAPVLFASREGRVLAPLAGLPAMRVVGGFAGPPRPTDPGDHDFPDQTALFAALAAAARDGDLAALAAAATRSAEANQARNPNPAWAAMAAMARRHGALGVAVSHTGPAISLILPPGGPGGPGGTDPAPAQVLAQELARELTAAGLRGIVDYRLPEFRAAAGHRSREFALGPESG